MKQLDSIKGLIKDIQSIYPVAAAYVFGSAARGQMRAHSDIDLAILFEREPEAMALFELKADLTGRAGRNVDLVALNSVSPILAMQVLRYGRQILVNDSKKNAEFVVKTYTMYHDLKMVRRPIEENILRGAIYG